MEDYHLYISSWVLGQAADEHKDKLKLFFLKFLDLFTSYFES